MAAATTSLAESSSPAKISRSALVILVLHWLLMDLLRNRCPSDTRICLWSDLLCGKLTSFSQSIGLFLSASRSCLNCLITHADDIGHPAHPLNPDQYPAQLSQTAYLQGEIQRDAVVFMVGGTGRGNVNLFPGRGGAL